MAFDDTGAGGNGGGGGGDDQTRDIAVVMYFVHGAAREGLMFNTWHGKEAFEAFCRLVQVDPVDAWDRCARTSEGL
jgi:hypothetical protein